MSTKPGHTPDPAASMVRAATSGTSPKATIRPLDMPTSPIMAGAPVPSTTMAPRSARSSTSGAGNELVHCAFDNGPFEERGIGSRVEACWVAEGQVREGILVDPLVIDHLPS